jgi:hypothetical protein
MAPVFMTEYYGATKKRMEQSAIIRELLLEKGLAYMRNRTKPIFTSWEVRLRIVDELREKTDDFKQRSLRRKLTKLDRALTDRQAHALDQAFSAWLILEGKSKSVDASAAGGKSSDDKLPLTEREFAQVARYKQGIAHWPSMTRHKLEGLFLLMAPWAENQNLKPDARSIQQIVELAKMLEKIY